VPAPLQSAVTAATASTGSQAATFTTANLSGTPSAPTKIICAVSVSWFSGAGTITGVSDGTNSLTLVGRKTVASTVDVSLWAMDSTPDVGTKPTITATASGTGEISMLIQEVPGLAAGNTTALMIDGTLASNSGSGGSSTGSAPYSSTAAGEDLIGVYGDNGGPETWTVPAGLTADPNSVNSNSRADIAIAYGSSTNGAESASWALTGSAAAWATLLVAFKLAPSSGGGASQISGPAWHPGAGLPGMPGGTPFYLPWSGSQPPAGTVPVTGTGSLALVKPSLSGTGAQDVTGSGSLALVKPSLAGTGAVAATGTGSLALVKPKLSGTGTGSAAPTVAVTWTGGSSVSSGFFFPGPQARPTQISVANVAGDWMFAIITWRQVTAGAGVTVSVADDAHNYWEPLGAPTGDSSAAGVTRTAIWYAPAARAATVVQVAPTGFVLGLVAIVADVTGMSKWFTLSAITPGFANANTALSLAIGAPASQALMLAGLGTDNNGDTITGPGAGWTALTTVSASNGVDTTADIQLHSAWRLATVGETAAWSSSGSLDLSGVTAGILVTTAPPAQPNPNWPIVITELDPGAGVTTPPSQTTWTALSPRSLAFSVTQGRQYTLGQLQAGQGTMTLDNPDGALIPPGTGAYAGIDSGTPVRQRIIIPSSPTPYYVPFSGFFQRWPFNLEQDMLRGQTQATILDVWAYAGGALTSMAREEILLDFPYAYWPCGDPAGSAGAANLATGNQNALTVTTSKLGGGGSVQVFGANSGVLTGDSSAKVTASGQGGGASGMWSQALAGTALTTNGYGYALTCTDTNYPSIANGVTIEGWFGFTAAPPAGWNPVIWSARNVKGPVMELGIDQATGHMTMRYGPGTGASVLVTVSTNDWRGTTALTHVAIAFSQTTYQVIIDGGAFTGASGTFSSPLPATFTRFDAGGIMDSAVNGYAWSGYTAHLAIFPLILSPQRVLSHYFSTRFGMVGEAACDRIERILEYGSLTGRRLLLQQVVLYEGDLCVSGQDIGGQPAASSISNIAASTVPAMMYVAPTGDLFYAAKIGQWNDPIRWVLGENTAAGEIPYLATMATDYDPARVVNDIQLTQLDTNAVTIPGGNGIGALEAASQNQYGDVPYQVTGYMQYDASSSYTGGGGLNDLASWLAYTYRKPQNRIQSVTVDAATHPSAWNFVAGVSTGDMVTVNLRPPTAATSPLVSITARVTQTTRNVQFSQQATTGSVTCVLDYAPEENSLICDDPVRGLLNGSNVIGW
jgi:hypothetical protein